MRLRLIGALVTVATLILVVFSIPLASFVARVERERLVTALERDAFILAGHAKETLNTTVGAVLPSLDPFIKDATRDSDVRVVVTNKTGLAVSSNDITVKLGTDFSNRPEVQSAMKGMPAVGERKSVTLGETLVYVAVPVLSGNSVLGVVRLSNPKSKIDSEVRSRIVGIIVAGLFTLVAAAAVAIPLALTLIRPIRRLTSRTERLSEGDFSARADDLSGPPEVRELSRAFNAMAGRLGLMIDNQRQFAGAVSHQLRTPLTVLRLRLEQAQDAVEDTDSALGQALDASRTETDRLQDMVEQLLALARLEGTAPVTVTVEALGIVTARIAMWEPLALEKSVSLAVVSHGSFECIAVKGALEQIVDNYIDNALTVAPEGSRISIEVNKVGGHVVIDVIDEGKGLSEWESSRAFERFWRGSQSVSGEGTGLGLAIVRQLATASGATVELLPATPTGVRARVTLLAR